MTNNEVEYKAVFSGFELAKVVGVESVVIQCNSQVVVGHINGDYKAKGEWMKEYLSMVKDRMSEGFLAKFIEIPREKNEQANHLAKTASARYTDVTSQVLSFVQYSPAIDKVEV